MKERIMKHFESQSALARKLEISRSVVCEWFREIDPEPIPVLRAFQIQRLTNGKVKAVSLNPKCKGIKL